MTALYIAAAWSALSVAVGIFAGKAIALGNDDDQ